MESAAFARVGGMFALVGAGFAARKLGILNRADGAAVLRFGVKFTLPAVLLLTFSAPGGALSGGLSPQTLAMAGAAVLYAAITVVAARAALKGRASREKATLYGVLLGVNVSNFSYPFVRAIWGDAGIKAAAVFDVPNALVTFGLVYALYTQCLARPQYAALRKHGDGGLYDGQWVDSAKGGGAPVGGAPPYHKHGSGVYAYPNSARYEGEWRQNTKHGHGVYFFANGGLYEGEWYRGQRHGLGVRTSPKGRVRAGRWEEGELVEPLPREDVAATVAAAGAAAAAAAKVGEEHRRAAEASSGGLPAVLARCATFPPLMAVWVAAAMALAGLSLPVAASSMLAPIASMNAPMTLIAMGALFELDVRRDQAITLFSVLGHRYALSLAMAAAAVALAPAAWLPHPAAHVLAVCMCMPIPAVTVQYAAAFNSDVALANMAVNVTNVLSLAVLLGIAATPTALLAPALAAGAALAWGAGKLGAYVAEEGMPALVKPETSGSAALGLGAVRPAVAAVGSGVRVGPARPPVRGRPRRSLAAPRRTPRAAAAGRTALAAFA